MHIGFRTSGGRGEYEIISGDSGQPASELEGWTFHMLGPDGRLRDTELWLDPAGSGKPRLRSLAQPPYQVGRLMAAILLLPEPHRELPETAVELPVVRQGEYLLMKVGFGPGTSFASPPESVQFTPNYIEAKNLDQVEEIGVAARWKRIEALYATSSQQNPRVADELNDHQVFLATGAPVNAALNRIVAALIKVVAETDPTYSEGTDPLPALERLVGLRVREGPDLPPPDEIGEEDIEVRARSAHDYRLSRSRGAAGRKFSLDVRKAYGYRCAFCGVVLGGLSSFSSGVDAAHVLAWSNYDLDVVSNGLSLCKLHHWAFDAALMVPEFRDGTYFIRFTDVAMRSFDANTLAHLGSDRFVIPDEWLPVEAKDRPNPKYLERLYEDLSVTFA